MRGAAAASYVYKSRGISSQGLRYLGSGKGPSKVLRDATAIERDLVSQPQYVLSRAVGIISNLLVAYQQSPQLLYRMVVVLPVTQLAQYLLRAISMSTSPHSF